MKRDEQIFNLIQQERERQTNGIELIASENFVSDQVMEAMGSVMTNKYAEGLPGKRYYGGCQIVDQSEQLAIDRVKQLFGCEWANVQPHSGAQANMAVLMADEHRKRLSAGQQRPRRLPLRPDLLGRAGS